MVSSAKADEQISWAWLPGCVLTQGAGLALLVGQECFMLWFSGPSQKYPWGILAVRTSFVTRGLFALK